MHRIQFLLNRRKVQSVYFFNWIFGILCDLVHNLQSLSSQHYYLTILTPYNQQIFAFQCSQSSYLRRFRTNRCKQSKIRRLLKMECFLGTHLAFPNAVVIEFAKVGTKHNTVTIHSHQTTDFFILLQLIQQLYLNHCIKHALLQTFSHRGQFNNEKTGLIVCNYCIFYCDKPKQFVFGDIFRDVGWEQRDIMIEPIGRVVFFGCQVPNDELPLGVDCQDIAFPVQQINYHFIQHSQ